MISEFVLVILLYGGNGPYLKTIHGFSTSESCVKAAQDFNGFVQKREAGAMAFCIEKK